MKALFFFLVATVIYVQCNGQFTDMCLPQPMREVPITLQIKNAPADLSACGGNGLLAIPELEALAEEQIVNRYQQTSGCRLVSLNHTSCKTKGRRGQRVLLSYMANLTCGDESCYHLGLHDRKNRNAIKFYSNHAKRLRNAYRIRSHSNFTYNDMRVEIIFFGGQKGDFHFNCSSNMIEDGVRENIPACGCPSSCAVPCELPPETGRCRAYFPRYYHNATSRQCERFIYGGCEGNQNRFESQDECETACNVCPEGMVYKECGTSCPSTCDNKDDLSVCTLQCVQGCFCKEGTVLLEEDGEVCVAPEKCPVTKPECPKGMVYRECGTACPATCDNKDDKFRICTLQCVQGCFCNESTVLLEEGSEVCVTPEKCPVKEPECPEGMVYRECGTACPDTCDNKDDKFRICTLQCVQGCFCNESTVLLEEDGEVCVAPEKCPVTKPECPEGMVYRECGTACPATCDNKDDKLRVCTLQCVQGCFCNESTVLLEEDGEVCVAPEKCPVKEPECPEGMVYRECGTACPDTCDNKDDKLRICTLQCVQGCFCNGSTVLLNSNSTQCVVPENCPEKPPEQQCPVGKVHNDCGTACPLTCENKDQNITCTKQCVAGCFCPTGFIEKGDLCVRPDECDIDICSLSPDAGPCRAYFPRYFYNSTSEQCDQFIYGGCRGNSNNFHTVEQCESTCKAKETECPEGMDYNECGTACPTTCANKDMMVPCTRQCVQGCFCSGDTVLMEAGGEVCVAENECPTE